MAFQDSTGGIVLDAVLTDIGRKRMASGEFRITKFCLGDDEIDYSLYKLPTGSSVTYNDTGIMTMPVMEAFGGQDANINYGLQNFVRNDIIYYPSVKVNTIVDEASNPRTDQFHYFAVNKETTRKLKTAFGHIKFVLQNNKLDNTKIVIESGLDLENVRPTMWNKEAYLLNMGLYDKYYLAYCDNRLFENLLVSREKGQFANDTSDNLYMNLEPLQSAVEITLPTISDFHSVYRIAGIDNEIYQILKTPPTSMWTDDPADHDILTQGSNYSNIKGPRSSIFAFNLKVVNEMTSDSKSSADYRYTKFGSTGQAILGGSDLYDFIDTTIYIQAMSSNARISVPIRIIRYAGT